MSVSEVSEYLGVVRESVYRWLAHGKMPGHKLGRHWKFRKDEVDTWVREGSADESKATAPRRSKKKRTKR